MAGVFISYRRGQAAGYAGRLADELARRFGKRQVFRDVEAISAGADFVQAIDAAVAACGAVVVVITPGWADIVDEAGRRRLDNAEDFARLEIEAALRRGTLVIPVLVGGASMPRSDQLPEQIRALARRQAHEIRDASWDYNVDQLVATLERRGLQSVPPPAAATAGQATHAPAGPPKSRRLPLMAAGLIGAVATVAVLSVAISSRQPADSDDPIQAEMGTPAATGGVTTDPKASLDDEETARREIEALIARAAQAEIAAFRDLDPALLMAVYDGAIRDDLTAAIEDLASNGFYALNTLHGRKIVAIDVFTDGTEAEVEMVESWSSEYRNDASGTCLYVPQHDGSQTLYLYRGPSGWRIEDVEHHDEAPDAVVC
jgi:hypothetical protein